jgi:hypothetical protein
LKLADQARFLWESDSKAAVWLLDALVAQPINELGETIFAALCDAVGPAAAIHLEARHPGLLTVLLDRSPALALSPSLWKLPLHRQREFVDVLAHKGNAFVRSSVGAMVDAGAREIAREVARVLGAEAAPALLQAVDANDRYLSAGLPSEWAEILKRDPDAVLVWLRASRPSAARLAFTIAHLNPHTQAAESFAPQMWLAAAADELETVGPDVRAHCAGFILAIGLRTHTANAGKLIGLGYPHIYRRAARDDLPYDVWQWLSDDLPPRYWYRQWDKCERLTLGLIDRFGQSDWPLESFLMATRDDDAFRQALDLAQRQRNPLVGRLLRELRHGDLSLTPTQKRALDEWRR